MNSSEQLVYNLCTGSFLSLWSYSNPLNDRSKELCDILVVCEPDILIFSVKEIEFKDTGRPKIDSDRWKREAIESSSKQIHGAARWINSHTHVITREGKVALPFPDLSIRKVHRVAVALGSKEKVSLNFGDMGKGFIHVLDEKSLYALLSELDTVSDFVRYLCDKEAFFYSGKMTLFAGEEDLLALYLTGDRMFPMEPSEIFLDEGLWDGLLKTPKVAQKKKQDELSYIWDNIIERLWQNYSQNNYLTRSTDGPLELSDIERSIRGMAREDRLSRRVLGKSLLELLENSKGIGIRIRARINDKSNSRIRYVFMVASYDVEREGNFKELQARCLVARGLDHSKQTVVGILIEVSEKHPGDAVTVVYLDVPDWTPEWQEKMDLFHNEFGFFKNLRRRVTTESEYPEVGD